MQKPGKYHPHPWLPTWVYMSMSPNYASPEVQKSIYTLSQWSHLSPVFNYHLHADNVQICYLQPWLLSLLLSNTQPQLPTRHFCLSDQRTPQTQPVQNQTRYFTPQKYVPPVFHSFIQQIFTEHLLSAVASPPRKTRSSRLSLRSS